MEKITFRETQLAAVEVLKKIDEISEKCNSKYFMFYGTLIGAVRHKGVIPWDDDVDIIMLRPDFKTFESYFESNKERLLPFKLVTYKNSKDYPYTIARVYDTRYKIEMKNEESYGMGVFVDIYIYDGMGSSLDEAVRLAQKSDKYSSLCFLSTRKKFARDNTKGLLKMFIKYPAYLYAKLLGKNYWFKKLEKLGSSYSFDNSSYVGSVMWLSGGRDEVYKKEWFNDPIRLQFEDYSFWAPKDYDEILTQHYGNYMKVPDDAGKKVHHDYDAYRL